MNIKLLTELASEAGLEVRAYLPKKHRVGAPTAGPEYFAIVTGDPVNSILDLVQVVVDNASDSETSFAGRFTDLEEVLKDLLAVLRNPKQVLDGMDIILYWTDLVFPADEVADTLRA